jgi:LysM repeat protein
MPEVEPAMTSGHKTAITLMVMAAIAVTAVYELSHLSEGDGGAQASRTTGASTTTAAHATAAPAPATTRAPTRYVVMQGDTVTSIARRFGVTTDAVVAANQLADPDRLSLGQALLIPPPPPVVLVVVPASVEAGTSVELRLTGAKPGESVTFTVTSPAGPFSGPAHPATKDGAVSASYTPSLDAPTGTFTVSAHGDQGTTGQTTFHVDASGAFG